MRAARDPAQLCDLSEGLHCRFVSVVCASRPREKPAEIWKGGVAVGDEVAVLDAESYVASDLSERTAVNQSASAGRTAYPSLTDP